VLPLRQRRTSVPARFGFDLHGGGGGDDDEDDDDNPAVVSAGRTHRFARAASLYARDDRDDAGIEAHDWESVGSSHGTPSAGMGASLLTGAKPTPLGDEPVSAARLSLGNRLKKSLGEGRPGALRRKSGGVVGWKRS
jgi:hypothetical protein